MDSPESLSFNGASFSVATSGPFDPVGNHAAVGAQSDRAGRLLRDGTHDYSYDLGGRLTLKRELASGDRRRFRYDDHDRLISVEDRPSGAAGWSLVADYVYDPIGRPVHDGRSRIIHAKEDRVAEIRANGDRVLVTQGPGVDAPLAVDSQAARLHLVADRQGNIVQLSDGQRAVAERHPAELESGESRWGRLRPRYRDRCHGGFARRFSSRASG